MTAIFIYVVWNTYTQSPVFLYRITLFHEPRKEREAHLRTLDSRHHRVCFNIVQWLLHNWSDEACVKILKNCRKAIPEKTGKVIIIDVVL